MQPATVNDPLKLAEHQFCTTVGKSQENYILNPKNCDMTYCHKLILLPFCTNDQCQRSHMEVAGTILYLYSSKPGAKTEY